MQPKISVITVNFNNCTGLEKTISSVLEQSFLDFEYIVIDGGSTDGSVSLIKKYSHLIKFWVSEPDKGIYDAMNKGLSFAKGAYVNFLNSGDVFESEFVTERVYEFISGSAPDMIIGTTNIVRPDGSIVSTRSYENIDPITLLIGMINHQSLFVKRDIFGYIGFFDSTFKIKADHDWLLRAVRNGYHVSYFSEPVVRYEVGGLSEKLKSIKLLEKKEIIRRHTSCLGMNFYRVYTRSRILHKSQIARQLVNRFLFKK